MQVHQFVSSKTRKAVNNHLVMIDDVGNISFQSYDKIAVSIDSGKSKITIYSNWNCSATTCKNFLNFMGQHFEREITVADIEKMLSSKNFDGIPVESIEY